MQRGRSSGSIDIEVTFVLARRLPATDHDRRRGARGEPVRQCLPDIHRISDPQGSSMSLIERAVSKIGRQSDLRRPDLPEVPAAQEIVAAGGAVPASNPLVPAGERDRPTRPGTGVPATTHRATAAANASPRDELPIDLHTLAARGFVTPQTTASALWHQFRVIKRPLLAKAYGERGTRVQHGHRIMVTSSVPGEGKTFCAINLAMSIAAERDHEVLLVDADVARPSVPAALGVPEGPGLMDRLIDGGPDIAQYICRTNVERLHILRAGRVHEQATEYLASASMGRLLDELSERFPERVIVFDSPPLLVTSEARVLARWVGQIVMVVAAGATSRALVEESLGVLEGCEHVGLLLNKSEESKHGSYYGYGRYSNAAS
jgi:receptor protein-tyrosine kinase